MIEMGKKYTRDGRPGVILTASALGEFPVIWQDAKSHIMYRYAANGTLNCYPGLVEVVPDTILYRYIYPANVKSFAAYSYISLDAIKAVHADPAIAIEKITIRNNGVNGPSDISIELLPK